MSSEIM